MKLGTWYVAALTVALFGMAHPIILDPFLTGAVVVGGAAALLGAAAIGAGAVGVGAIGAAKLGAAGVGAIGAAKLGAVGTAKLGAVGAGAIGAAKVGAIGAGAIGAAKLGVVGAGALGAAKIGAIGAGKVGLAKVGLGTVLHSGFSSGVRSNYNNQHSDERNNQRYGGTFGKRVTVSFGGNQRRYKREVGGYNAAQEMLLTDAYALDQEKPCGLRLVCELATKGADELEADELLIMAMLNEPNTQSSMAVPYKEAANLGWTSASSAMCAEEFKRCPLNRFEIMQVLREQFVA